MTDNLFLETKAFPLFLRIFPLFSFYFCLLLPLKNPVARTINRKERKIWSLDSSTTVHSQNPYIFRRDINFQERLRFPQNGLFRMIFRVRHSKRTYLSNNVFFLSRFGLVPGIYRENCQVTSLFLTYFSERCFYENDS